MKCSKCGTEFDSRFCPNCGTAAFDLPAAIQTPHDSSTKQTEQTSKFSELLNGKTKWFVIGAIALFIIIVIVLIIVFASGSGKSDNNTDKISQYAGATTSQSSTAAAAAPQTTTQSSSSLVGTQSSSQASSESAYASTSEASSNATSNSASGSILGSILGSDSQTTSQSDTESTSSPFADGMTYQQVKKIIGSDGMQQSSIGNSVVYIWKGKGFSGSDLSLTFKDGKLDLSMCFGLD